MMVDLNSTNSIANGDYYYGHDHLYSPAVLFYEDGTGAEIVERYEYDAYGKVQVLADSDGDGTWFDDAGDTVCASSQYGNPYAFTGRRLDVFDYNSTTGDYDYEIMYYRARYYDTDTGRFLTHDPMEYIDGVNMYEYVMSVPTQYSDAYGLYTGPIIVPPPGAGGGSVPPISPDPDAPSPYPEHNTYSYDLGKGVTILLNIEYSCSCSDGNPQIIGPTLYYSDFVHESKTGDYSDWIPDVVKIPKVPFGVTSSVTSEGVSTSIKKCPVGEEGNIAISKASFKVKMSVGFDIKGVPLSIPIFNTTVGPIVEKCNCCHKCEEK